jgi:hypothetical protein
MGIHGERARGARRGAGVDGERARGARRGAGVDGERARGAGVHRERGVSAQQRPAARDGQRG